MSLIWEGKNNSFYSEEKCQTTEQHIVPLYLFQFIIYLTTQRISCKRLYMSYMSLPHLSVSFLVCPVSLSVSLFLFIFWPEINYSEKILSDTNSETFFFVLSLLICIEQCVFLFHTSSSSSPNSFILDSALYIRILLTVCSFREINMHQWILQGIHLHGGMLMKRKCSLKTQLILCKTPAQCL